MENEPNPATPSYVNLKSTSNDVHGLESISERPSYISQLTSSFRSFIHTQPFSSHRESSSSEPSCEYHRCLHAQNQNLRSSISGPSHFNITHGRPERSTTESDLYLNASPIQHVKIEHPDLEKGLPSRPGECGERTTDLIEAELISGQIRRIDYLRQERLEKSLDVERERGRVRGDEADDGVNDDEGDDDRIAPIPRSRPTSHRNGH